MNDFTKDELEEIVCALKEDLNKHYEPYHKDVLDKVQSMIDSYCEHELCAIDYSHQAIRCKSCKEIVE